MSLYKYRTMSKYSIEGLMNNEVFFSSFEHFNDPFEFSNPMTDLSVYNMRARRELKRLYLKGVFSHQDYLGLLDLVAEPQGEDKENRQVLMEKIERGFSTIGVFCLSEIDNNILMWSHYGEEHKGFCVEFSELSNQLVVANTPLNVNYIEEYQDLNDPTPLINFYIEMFSKSKNLKEKKWKAKYKKYSKAVTNKEDAELGVSVLSNKFIDWSYEKEVRLVTNQLGVIKYNPKAVKNIIFGLRMSESDRLVIRDICRSDDKRHIKFKQAIKKEGGFGINVVEVNDK